MLDAAVALKVVVVAPAGTVTLLGTANNPLLLATLTVVPPAAAACVSVTVQVAVFPALRDVGVHPREPTFAWLPNTTPPLPLSDICVPLGDAANPFTPILVMATPWPSVTFTVATVPFAIAVAFSPDSRHVRLPEPDAQTIDFLALVAALPTPAEIASTCVGRNESVNCKLAGADPLLVRFRLNEAYPFVAAVPELKTSASL